jgi:hypothetical protein
MAQKSSRISIGAWKRFHAHGLTVSPRLAGACLEFAYKGFQIEIRLPKKPKQQNWHDHTKPRLIVGHIDSLAAEKPDPLHNKCGGFLHLQSRKKGYS